MNTDPPAIINFLEWRLFSHIVAFAGILAGAEFRISVTKEPVVCCKHGRELCALRVYWKHLWRTGAPQIVHDRDLRALPRRQFVHAIPRCNFLPREI